MPSQKHSLRSIFSGIPSQKYPSKSTFSGAPSQKHSSRSTYLLKQQYPSPRNTHLLGVPPRSIHLLQQKYSSSKTELPISQEYLCPKSTLLRVTIFQEFLSSKRKIPTFQNRSTHLLGVSMSQEHPSPTQNYPSFRNTYLLKQN